MDVEGGDADDQLGALKFVKDKLASLVPANTTVSSAKTLFSKIKKPMGDQWASKKFVRPQIGTLSFRNTARCYV